MTKLPAWREEAIAKHHNRTSFDCGDNPLNDFFRLHARQSHEKGASKTFLAISDDDQSILGFYSLSPASLVYDRAPEVIKRGLARHEVPVFLLGRLAVATQVQNQGLGGQLLLAAGRRCLRVATQVGGVALYINAKNERAAKWYMSYGAFPLLDAPLSLLLPLKTIQAAINGVGGDQESIYSDPVDFCWLKAHIYKKNMRTILDLPKMK